MISNEQWQVKRVVIPKRSWLGDRDPDGYYGICACGANVNRHQESCHVCNAVLDWKKKDALSIRGVRPSHAIIDEFGGTEG